MATTVGHPLAEARRVWALADQGLTDERIGVRLGMSVDTVRWRKEYRKLTPASQTVMAALPKERVNQHFWAGVALLTAGRQAEILARREAGEFASDQSAYLGTVVPLNRMERAAMNAVPEAPSMEFEELCTLMRGAIAAIGADQIGSDDMPEADAKVIGRWAERQRADESLLLDQALAGTVRVWIATDGGLAIRNVAGD